MKWRRLILGVVVGMVSSCGFAQVACSARTPEQALPSGSVAATDQPISTSSASFYRLARIVVDPELHRRWALIANCTHPERPLEIVALSGHVVVPNRATQSVASASLASAAIFTDRPGRSRASSDDVFATTNHSLESCSGRQDIHAGSIRNDARNSRRRSCSTVEFGCATCVWRWQLFPWNMGASGRLSMYDEWARQHCWQESWWARTPRSSFHEPTVCFWRGFVGSISRADSLAGPVAWGKDKKTSPIKPNPASEDLAAYIAQVRKMYPGGTSDGSIWSATGRLTSLPTDVKALNPHDLISIIISENLSASTGGTVKNSRASTAISQLSASVWNFFRVERGQQCRQSKRFFQFECSGSECDGLQSEHHHRRRSGGCAAERNSGDRSGAPVGVQSTNGNDCDARPGAPTGREPGEPSHVDCHFWSAGPGGGQGHRQRFHVPRQSSGEDAATHLDSLIWKAAEYDTDPPSRESPRDLSLPAGCDSCGPASRVSKSVVLVQPQ